jgi:hypothetical protein
VTTTADARDRAQFILGAVSLVIWFVVAFSLGVAALPWLAYRPLVKRLTRQR